MGTMMAERQRALYNDRRGREGQQGFQAVRVTWCKYGELLSLSPDTENSDNHPLMSGCPENSEDTGE